MRKIRILFIFMGIGLSLSAFPNSLGAYEPAPDTAQSRADGTLGVETVSLDSSLGKQEDQAKSREEGVNEPDGKIELQLKVKEQADVLEDYVEDDKDIPVDASLVDPFEDFNRTMYKVNDALYENFMEPVAGVYADVTDSDFRGIVSSFFENLTMPVQLVSSLLQGDASKAGRTLARFLINTTIGSGGMVDVAKTEFHIKKVDENFEQALGYHGVKSGPYIVLPLMGPTTARGAAGKFVDGFLNPARFFMAGAPVVNFGVSVGKKINETAMNLDVKQEIDDISIDPYLCIRDLYLQHVQAKIKE